MANMNIRSKECSWHHCEVKVLDRVITGIRGWEVKTTTEKEPLYGAGQEAIDIVEGNRKHEGNFKVLGFEADAMNRAAQIAGFSDLLEVPHEAIVATIKFRKTPIDPITIITVRGVSFTENGDTMEQGAKNRETTLPFIAMDIKKVTSF